jgi:hypothetical protein
MVSSYLPHILSVLEHVKCSVFPEPQRFIHEWRRMNRRSAIKRHKHGRFLKAMHTLGF